MSIKSGFGRTGNMNGGRQAKTNTGKTKAGFGKANTGSKSVSGYSSK